MKIFQYMFGAWMLASALYPCQTQAVPPPAAPSNLVVQSVSSSRLDVSWTDNATNEVSFQLEFATNPTFKSATSVTLTPANRTRLIHTGRNALTTYWYRIKANVGSSWSNTAFATTAPSGVSATAAPRNGAIDVRWNPNRFNSNIIGYTVRYGIAPDFSDAVDKWVAGNGRSTYSATGLLSNQAYYVSVKAVGPPVLALIIFMPLRIDYSHPYSSAFSAVGQATTLPPLVGTPISPLFFGQNAWLPDKIGAEEKGGDLEVLLCGPNYASTGVCVPAEVYDSGVKLMRYGGKAVDSDYDPLLSPPQYLTMVDNMSVNGIEPLLQVPYFNGTYDATQAEALVRYINITHDRSVTYWTIANEPDQYYDRDVTPAINIATDIAAYFRPIAMAMRAIDPSIAIVGPDLSFNDDAIMMELTAPGGLNNICDYLDIINFHTYPFGEGPRARADVIARPQGGFQNSVDDLKDRVNECGTELKMAVTETNVEYQYEDPQFPDRRPEGLSSQSFLAGQFWADMMNVGMKNGLEFMAFWSIKEAGRAYVSVSDKGAPQLGYIENEEGTKLSTYYHYQMLAQNFRGVYAAGIDNTSDVTAFGAKDHDQIVVMLLNQTTTSSLDYKVRLRTGAFPGGSQPLKVNIDAGVTGANDYSNPVREPLAPESTVLLVFDANGIFLRRYVYALSNAEPVCTGTGCPTARQPAPRLPAPRRGPRNPTGRSG